MIGILNRISPRTWMATWKFSDQISDQMYWHSHHIVGGAYPHIYNKHSRWFRFIIAIATQTHTHVCSIRQWNEQRPRKNVLETLRHTQNIVVFFSAETIHLQSQKKYIKKKHFISMSLQKNKVETKKKKQCSSSCMRRDMKIFANVAMPLSHGIIVWHLPCFCQLNSETEPTRKIFWTPTNVEEIMRRSDSDCIKHWPRPFFVARNYLFTLIETTTSFECIEQYQ